MGHVNGAEVKASSAICSSLQCLMTFADWVFRLLLNVAGKHALTHAFQNPFCFSLLLPQSQWKRVAWK